MNKIHLLSICIPMLMIHEGVPAPEVLTYSIKSTYATTESCKFV
ncbi:MAG: hypothetical protein NTV01_02415 [Bacteroidia bacterium]|nr:hypothetical protein [Bacteroidia bacterium]